MYFIVSVQEKTAIDYNYMGKKTFKIQHLYKEIIYVFSIKSIIMFDLRSKAWVQPPGWT